MINPQVNTVDLLDPKPHCLMLEYTSRCNLRCTYCTKSLPQNDQVPGRNQDMNEDVLSSTIDLFVHEHFSELLLAGTGESTFHPNWLQDAPVIIHKVREAIPRCFIYLNSNFSRRFDHENLKVLSYLDCIVISIDTLDRQITKKTRAKSDIDVILSNIIRFHGYCSVNRLKLPNLRVNVTLHEGIVHTLFELCVTLSHLPVQSIVISDMIEFDPLVQLYGIRKVGMHNQKFIVSFIDEVNKIASWAAKLGRPLVHLQPSLQQRIAKISNGHTTGNSIQDQSCLDHMNNRDNMTRVCIQPWSRFTIAANGDIFPCCVTEMVPVGQVGMGPENGLNGHRLRKFRNRLLKGDMPQPCKRCSNAPMGKTSELVSQVLA